MDDGEGTVVVGQLRQAAEGLLRFARKTQENTRKRKEAEKKAKEAKAAAMSSAGLAGVPNMSRAAPARHQGGILKESRPSTVAPLAVQCSDPILWLLAALM